MTSRAFYLLAATAFLAIGAFFIGRQLRPAPGQASVFDVAGPAYTTAKPIAGFSRGGFSGFGEVDGMDGRTVAAGRIVSVDAGAIVIESAAGARSTISLSGNGPLKQIDSVDRSALRPGVSIVVRKTSDEAAAVLIVAEP